MSMLRRGVTVGAVRLRGERGDVPGWVLITLLNGA